MSPMEELRQRILDEGRDLGNGILKVDGFINHRIDASLMRRCGEALARVFEDSRPGLVLTAEISGIAPALSAAVALSVPVVYARKVRPVTMAARVYSDRAPSRTKGGETPLYVSSEHLAAGERVLIVDDFLSTGQTISALARIVQQAGAMLVGVGTLVEKRFEGGRLTVSTLGVPIVSLAVITSMRDGKIDCESP